MSKPHTASTADAVTSLIPDLFRLSARLMAEGDRLVAGLGLTSARWQMLGAIVAAEHPQPVAWLARDLGASRQNVQRIVNDLAADGLVRFEANPHHKRAQLVMLTDAGAAAFGAAMALQGPWVEKVAENTTPDAVATARRVVAALSANLARLAEARDGVVG